MTSEIWSIASQSRMHARIDSDRPAFFQWQGYIVDSDFNISAKETQSRI